MAGHGCVRSVCLRHPEIFFRVGIFHQCSRWNIADVDLFPAVLDVGAVDDAGLAGDGQTVGVGILCRIGPGLLVRGTG